MNATPRRWLLGIACAVAASAARAHAGDATDSLMAGLTHPLGADHVLAALALGLWCARAGVSRDRRTAPAALLGGLLCGAIAGVLFAPHALPEFVLGASVALFGALLIAPRALARPLVLIVLTAAAVLQGAFHGAEGALTPAFGLYLAGLMVASSASVAGGLLLGALLDRTHRQAWRAAAAALGAAGVMLMALA